MFFSGLDVVLVYLFGLALARWARGSRIDRAGGVDGTSPMGLFAAVSLGPVADAAAVVPTVPVQVGHDRAIRMVLEMPPPAAAALPL